jgi:hypothetical protein
VQPRSLNNNGVAHENDAHRSCADRDDVRAEPCAAHAVTRPPQRITGERVVRRQRLLTRSSENNRTGPHPGCGPFLCEARGPTRIHAISCRGPGRKRPVAAAERMEGLISGPTDPRPLANNRRVWNSFCVRMTTLFGSPTRPMPGIKAAPTRIEPHAGRRRRACPGDPDYLRCEPGPAGQARG